MRIAALVWPTFDNETELMINQRGDLLCPAIDGLTNELLKLGHQVLYVNLFQEHRGLTDREKNCIGMISGLSFHKWEYIRNRKFDLIWCAIKDPTPKQCLPYVEKVLAELQAENPNTPILNDARKLADHTKNKYIKVMRSKNVGAILKTEEQVKHLKKPDGTWARAEADDLPGCGGSKHAAALGQLRPLHRHRKMGSERSAVRCAGACGDVGAGLVRVHG
jgi:hypothetical protein